MTTIFETQPIHLLSYLTFTLPNPAPPIARQIPPAIPEWTLPTVPPNFLPE